MIKENFIAYNDGALTATKALRELDGSWARGVIGYLDITAVSGTSPTLDLKIQGYEPTADKWFDVTDAVIAQQTATGTVTFMLYPGINDAGSDQANIIIPRVFRFHATVGGTDPSFTFTLAGDLLE